MGKTFQKKINIFPSKKKRFFKKKQEKNEFLIEQIHDTNYKYLPNYSENIRPLPNAILRSALFGVVGKGLRIYEEDVLKPSINGITVKFTGNKLDQNDLDVWLECINRFKKVKVGEMIRFSSYSFLKSIGKKTGRYEYQWLRSCLIRLASCLIELGDGRFFYSGHLLNEKYKDKKSYEFVIIMNPKFIFFFMSDMWTGVSIEERKKLKGKQLSKWLHGFFSTHREPFAYKINTLRHLCGSNTKVLKKFKQNLIKSLVDLSFATGWYCWIDENDLVHVTKNNLSVISKQ